MGTETRFVDITYRGLRVAAKAKLVEQAPMTGFVEVEAPLPVGTQVTVVDGEQSVAARVLAVVEQEAGAKSPPGMRITWAPVAERVVPKPQLTAEPPQQSAEATDPNPIILDDSSSVLEADAGLSSDALAAAEAVAADPSTAPAEDQTNGGRRRRKTRKTQVGRP